MSSKIECPTQPEVESSELTCWDWSPLLLRSLADYIEVQALKKKGLVFHILDKCRAIPGSISYSLVNRFKTVLMYFFPKMKCFKGKRTDLVEPITVVSMGTSFNGFLTPQNEFYCPDFYGESITLSDPPRPRLLELRGDTGGCSITCRACGVKIKKSNLLKHLQVCPKRTQPPRPPCPPKMTYKKTPAGQLKVKQASPKQIAPIPMRDDPKGKGRWWISSNLAAYSPAHADQHKGLACGDRGKSLKWTDVVEKSYTFNEVGDLLVLGTGLVESPYAVVATKDGSSSTGSTLPDIFHPVMCVGVDDKDEDGLDVTGSKDDTKLVITKLFDTPDNHEKHRMVGSSITITVSGEAGRVNIAELTSGPEKDDLKTVHMTRLHQTDGHTAHNGKEGLYIISKPAHDHDPTNWVDNGDVIPALTSLVSMEDGGADKEHNITWKTAEAMHLSGRGLQFAKLDGVHAGVTVTVKVVLHMEYKVDPTHSHARYLTPTNVVGGVPGAAHRNVYQRIWSGYPAHYNDFKGFLAGLASVLASIGAIVAVFIPPAGAVIGAVGAGVGGVAAIL